MASLWFSCGSSMQMGFAASGSAGGMAEGTFAEEDLVTASELCYLKAK